MTKENYLKGKKGERIALEYLEKAGYKVLETNYHGGRKGEIDIIALDGDILAFIEVKCYCQTNYIHPLQAVNSKKIKHIISSAKKYYYSNKIKRQCRYDVLAIEENNVKESKYTLVKDAFRESR